MRVWGWWWLGWRLGLVEDGLQEGVGEEGRLFVCAWVNVVWFGRGRIIQVFFLKGHHQSMAVSSQDVSTII